MFLECLSLSYDYVEEDFKVPQNVWKLGKVLELVKGRDGKTRGTKLLTVSSSGLQRNCYRTVIKVNTSRNCQE